MSLFISFSLKPLKEAGRTFEDAILPVLQKIAEENPDEPVHHGFMTPNVLTEKGWPTTVPDAFEDLFNHVVYHFDPETGKPDRDKMADLAWADSLDNKVQVIVIGPLVEGVADEVAAYQSKGLVPVALPWAELPVTA